MSYASVFEHLPIERLRDRSLAATESHVRSVLDKSRLALDDFAVLISPAAQASLEIMGQRSCALTQQRFGKVVRLFAPLYLSNECINNCKYCGFSRDNPILRVTLSLEEVITEARSIQAQGFRNLLLVAGEQPRFVSSAYLEECVRLLHPLFPSISLEVGPLETEDYRKLVRAGAEGLVVYHETYDRVVYEDLHTSGPKRDFMARLEVPERGYAAGMRRLGIGALLGLAEWRQEILSLAAHALYLQRHCWKAYLTISLPRMRPHAGGYQPQHIMGDRELAQVVCALRLMFPDIGLVLSTREKSTLRDGLIPLGITLMSAGSHTEPGGYTGAGQGKLHFTQRGKIVPLTTEASEWATTPGATSQNATVQFEIADRRSPAEVADVLRRMGYEPVWKDWDLALAGADADNHQVDQPVLNTI
jgi:2-iminoacetate synthase